MQTGDSYLLAFDKETGKEAWKQERELNAPRESAQSYTTPVVIGEGDEQTIIVLGADHVTAHDAKTGKQKWICGGLNPNDHQMFRSISSPVVTDKLVIAPYARGKSLTAIKLGGTGDVTKSHVAWSNSGPSSDVPTPLVADGKLYVLTDRGSIVMYDVNTGKEITSLSLPRRARKVYSSSMILANGHLYATNEGAVTHVIKIGDKKMELAASNDLEDFTVSTPIFSDSKVYLRTDKHLYCFAKKK
jgi:outer membrane protein assembly factor BamB